jgi:hypothetical protein
LLSIQRLPNHGNLPQVKILWAYHAVALIWVSQFILACQELVIGSVVATFYFAKSEKYGRMARGGHGDPRVSLRPAMPYPTTPTPKTALKAVSVVACPQAGRPVAVFYPLEHPTPCASGVYCSALSVRPSKSNQLSLEDSFTCLHFTHTKKRHFSDS